MRKVAERGYAPYGFVVQMPVRLGLARRHGSCRLALNRAVAWCALRRTVGSVQQGKSRWLVMAGSVTGAGQGLKWCGMSERLGITGPECHAGAAWFGSSDWTGELLRSVHACQKKVVGGTCIATPPVLRSCGSGATRPRARGLELPSPVDRLFRWLAGAHA